MKKISSVFLLMFVSLTGLADISGGGISDYFGNPITSRFLSGQWPLDVQINGTLPGYASTPTFNLGTLNGAATAANQVTAQTSLTSIDSKLTSPITVTGPLTDTQLRATAVPVSQSGTWTVQQGSTPTSVANAWPIKLTDGSVTNTIKTLGTQVVSTDNGIVTNSVIHGLSSGGGGGYVDVKANPSGALTVDATQSGAWSVTANAGTNLNTSLLALDSTVAKDSSLSTINTSVNTLLKPASTLAAVTTLGSITSALPAGTNLLGKVGIDQTTPGTTNGVQVNAALPTGTNSIGQVTANAGTNLNTSLLALQSGMNSNLDKASTGSLGALNAAVSVATNGMSTTTLAILGTWVGTISFQGSNDGGSTYPFAADGIVIPTGAVLTFVSSNAQFKIPCGAYTNVRVIMTSYTSGSATIALNAGLGPTVDRVFSTNAGANLGTSWLNDGSGNAVTSQANGSQRPLDVGINVSGVQVDPRNITAFGGTNVSTGTGAGGSGIPRVTVSNDSKVIAWDGTNTSKVVAASTLPAFGDTAIEVTQRPDNTGTVTQTSVSCASTTTTLLAAATATMFISVRNPTTATQTVWVNIAGASATAAAPNIDLPPGAEADFYADGASWLPSQQLNCISGGTASTVTLVYK